MYAVLCELFKSPLTFALTATNRKLLYWLTEIREKAFSVDELLVHCISPVLSWNLDVWMCMLYPQYFRYR